MFLVGHHPSPSVPKTFGTSMLAPLQFDLEQARNSVFLAGHPRFLSLWSGTPASAKIFETSWVPRIVWETTTKFCTVINIDGRQILTGRPRLLIRDLFAVANLLVFILFYCSRVAIWCNKLYTVVHFYSHRLIFAVLPLEFSTAFELKKTRIKNNGLTKWNK